MSVLLNGHTPVRPLLPLFGFSVQMNMYCLASSSGAVTSASFVLWCKTRQTNLTESLIFLLLTSC